MLTVYYGIWRSSYKKQYIYMYLSENSSKTYFKLKKIAHTYVHKYTYIEWPQFHKPNCASKRSIIDLHCYVDITYVIPYVCVSHIYCTLGIIVGEKSIWRAHSNLVQYLPFVREMKLSRADGGFYVIHITWIFLTSRLVFKYYAIPTFKKWKKIICLRRHGFPMAELR